jgi:hypothetical protein
MTVVEPGDQVVLSAMPENDVEEETGVVLSVEELSWGVSLVVQVTPEDSLDDGLRECTLDQVVEVLL